MIRFIAGLALLAGLCLSTGCDEMTFRTVHRPPPRQDAGTGLAQTDESVITDCKPACKPPKYCDTTAKPPKCVVNVNDKDGSHGRPESYRINFIVEDRNEPDPD